MRVLLMIAGLGVLPAACAIQEPRRALREFEDAALDAERSGRLSELLRGLGVQEREGFRGTLELVATLPNDRREDLTVVLWLEDPVKVPGLARIRAVVLDSRDQIRKDIIFAAGWRAFLDKALRWPGRRDVLEVRMMGDAAREQYYALVGDTLTLVRLEGERQEPLRVSYSHPNHTVGPVKAPEDLEDCCSGLSGSSWARRLSLLVWLGGHHWNGQEPNLWHEAPELATRAETFRENRRVQALLFDLMKSADPWTRDAARQLLD